MKNDIWHRIDYLREEGTFTGTVEKAEITTGGDGCKLIVRLRPPKNDFALPAGGMSQKLYNHLFADDIMADGCVKIGVFRSGWKHCQDPDVNDEWTETSIDTLIYHLRPVHRITFRMSKNWRRDRYYCRYIRNHSTGEWSGYETESDWRQASHPYTMLPEGIEYITIKHADRIETDYGYDLSLEISPQDDKWMIYRTYAQSGTDAYKVLNHFSLDELIGINVKVGVSVDPETGRSYITEIDMGEQIPKKETLKRGRKKTVSSYISYQEMSDIANSYPKIKNLEFDETGGVYDAEVLDLDTIDYNRGYLFFVPFRLSDGRVVMPKIRKRDTKQAQEIKRNYEGMTDLLENTKGFYPGLKVKLIYTKYNHSDNMALQAVFTDKTIDQLIHEKTDFYRNRPISSQD